MKEIDYLKARQFLKDKESRRQQQLDERFEKAQQDFTLILNKIIANYDPIRIYQWGSLLERNHFSEISDIDIAVEGITSAEQYFKMFGDIMNLSDFSIDLIQLEKIEPEFADLIRQKGKVVYERSK
jgi:predicted nucleotidyltransferase